MLLCIKSHGGGGKLFAILFLEMATCWFSGHCHFRTLWEDPLEKGKATHCSILTWRIPWIVWSMESQRVGHN